MYTDTYRAGGKAEAHQKDGILFSTAGHLLNGCQCFKSLPTTSSIPRDNGMLAAPQYRRVVLFDSRIGIKLQMYEQA